MVNQQWKIGALLSAENHEWFNKQTPEAQAAMNRMFQEYKECSVEYVDHLKLDFTVKAAIVTFDEPEQKKEKFNRAKVNREFKRRIEEDLEEWEI